VGRLTEHPSIEHHRSVEYRKHDYQSQASGFTVTSSADGRHVEVVGTCPGCGGRTTTDWYYGTGNGYKGLFRRHAGSQPAPDSRWRTVCCDCGHAHANHPDDDANFGCGAYWQVELP